MQCGMSFLAGAVLLPDARVHAPPWITVVQWFLSGNLPLVF